MKKLHYTKVNFASNSTSARLEECVQSNPGETINYCDSLAAITMKLMQKYERKDAIGVDDIHRWPPSSPAVDFLSLLTSTGSLRQLRDVRIYCYDTVQLDH